MHQKAFWCSSLAKRCAAPKDVSAIGPIRGAIRWWIAISFESFSLNFGVSSGSEVLSFKNNKIKSTLQTHQTHHSTQAEVRPPIAPNMLNWKQNSLPATFLFTIFRSSSPPLALRWHYMRPVGNLKLPRAQAQLFSACFPFAGTQMELDSSGSPPGQVVGNGLTNSPIANQWLVKN